MKPASHLSEIFRGFLHLLYPVLCVSCERELPVGSSCFCLKCRLSLEPSDHLEAAENEFTARFWGRLPLTAGASMYFFHRKSPVQRALHHLKYKNKPDIGVRMGRIFGKQLAASDLFADIDAVVAIPLHPARERQRGYNQSEMFGRGLAESLQAPLLEKALVRNIYTETQTHKKRLDRFQNVEQVFQAPKPGLIEGRHILLVDDVLTTGATLEAAGAVLFRAGAHKLSMATIASAINRNY